MIYLIIVNILAFLLYGIDKLKAKHHAWRISEKALLAMSMIGGAYGSYLGMILFHHKVRKPVFCIGVPFMILLETILIYCLKFS